MPRNPWAVPITSLRRVPGARQAERRSGHVGDLRVADTSVPPGAEAEADVVLDVIDGGIEVSGTVSAPWVAECRRCLRPVTGLLQVPVRELYAAPGRAGGLDAEETYPLVGELLDLTPLVRDALLLDLPLAPLCSADCAGLCPTCGAVLADGPCGCGPAPADPRWSSLDALREPGGH